MFYYSIGNTTFESWDNFELKHEKEFSEAEFKAMVFEAMADSYAKEIAESREYYAQEKELIEGGYIVEFCRVHHLFNRAISYLKETFGFEEQKLIYTQECDFFGDENPFEQENQKDDDGNVEFSEYMKEKFSEDAKILQMYYDKKLQEHDSLKTLEGEELSKGLVDLQQKLIEEFNDGI